MQHAALLQRRTQRAMQAVLEVELVVPLDDVREQVAVEGRVVIEQDVEREHLLGRDQLVEPDLPGRNRRPVAQHQVVRRVGPALLDDLEDHEVPRSSSACKPWQAVRPAGTILRQTETQQREGAHIVDGFILTLSCPDRVGIVHAVTGFLSQHRCNIVDSQQFGDRDTGRFFMRVHLEGNDEPRSLDDLRDAFARVGETFAMDWHIDGETARARIVIMVSQQGHCLNDLLYRWRIGSLPGDIAAIVSNHRDFEALAKSYEVPYHYVPVTTSTRDDAEQRLLDIVAETGAELVILARYMQVLSARVCEQLPGRIINIHHSFLPSFKGAKPYHQAHDRGVKLIGATAHYVTANLDDGPIIEQEVARVDHGDDVENLTSIGRDVECLALARAVRWHLEHRVLLDGHKTIVFR